MVRSLAGPNPIPGEDGAESDIEDDDDDDKDKVSDLFTVHFRTLHVFIFQEEKKSLKERLQAIQEVTQTVQNAIGHIASLGEAVKKYDK